MIPCALLGTGSALPPDVVDNAALAARLGVDMAPDLIFRKTGIAERRWSAPGARHAPLGAEALTRALELAGLAAGDLDRLVHCSSSGGDDLSPSTASGVAAELGARHLDCFDLNNACSAFLTALDVAARSVATGSGPVGVVCTEITSDILDRTDLRTALIFGDAAAAAIVGPATGRGGIVGSFAATDPSFGQTTYMEHPRRTGAPTQVRFGVENREMVDQASALIRSAVSTALARAGVGLADIRHVAPHQPNGRMFDRILDDLGIDPARALKVCDRIGSTGCAALPFGLDAIVRERGLEADDLVLMLGIGGGVSYGATVLRVDAALGTRNTRQ